MSSNSATMSPNLSEDELDDLIYFARTGDLEELTSTVTTLATSHSTDAEKIISAAIDLDPEDPSSSSGCSLLHWAAANNHVDVLKYLLQSIGATTTASSESIPFKPRNGGLANHQNGSGNTALHWAGLNGNLECVKLLVYAGADPSIRNSAGKDAVFEAETGELNKNGPPQNIEDDAQTGNRGAEDPAKTQKEVGVVDWLLESCEGLDKGFGGEAEVQAGSSGAVQDAGNQMDVDG